MIKNLLLVAIRNFKKDKWYSLLNILGLTIGITFSLFLIFYIKDELNYDRYNKKADRLFRINSFIKEPERDTMRLPITQYVLAPVLKKDFPEVEEAVRLVSQGKTLLKAGDLRFYENKVYAADSNLFRVFTYQPIEGDLQTALVAPRSIVLTQSTAVKYFGRNKSAIGQVLQNDKGEAFKVTAVIKDVPRNSHLLFNVLISTSTFPKDYRSNWGSFNMYTYVLLKPNTHPAAFEDKLKVMYGKYMASTFDQFHIKIRYTVQPVTAIHLHSDMSNEPEELGSVSYIYIFSAVAFFMLLIACINYMNLTTARSAKRAKEIGIRKVAGSVRSQLIAQFLVESTLVAGISLLLSMAFVALLLPTFNILSGKSITFGALLEPGTFLILLAVVIFVGLVGGSYPAFYLSKFQPINILKGSLSKSSSNATLRRALVVVQFSISMIMLICTWVIYGQLNYLRTRDLGFNKQQVLSLAANANYDVRGKVITFQNEMRKQSGVLSVSTAMATPGNGDIDFNLFNIQTDHGYVNKGVDCYGVDENYLHTLGMQLKQGRNFTGVTDTNRSVIVNENMVKYFGWTSAIGKKIKPSGDTTSPYLEVVGVVKDFNQKSLYNPIAPLILFYTPNNNGIQLKLQAQGIPATIAGVEKSWKAIFPDLPFTYTFLDQDFDSQYAADQKRGKIFTTFSILTILVTCLGLLGLIAFITEQRQKEISIRKVMGAGLRQIVPLLTRNFMWLVALSCLVAFPVAWIFMDKWLKIFPYNTGLSFVPFVLSALAVLLITMLTVTFHTVRAAIANPAQSLRAQ